MAMPPHRLKKQELLDALIHTGEDPKNLHGKKRPELLKMFKEYVKGEEANVALDEVEDAEDTTTNESDIPEVPSQTDPGWTQYVLGQFTEDEVEGENPRVEGLRRVAEELIGRIMEEGCDLVDAPSINNNMRASVKAWVIFADGVRFEALADASPDNIDGVYANYLVAMADTRAKGRCFRNALKLKRVVSAEEVGTPSLTPETAKAIHTGQITAIRQLCNRNDININKLLDHLKVEYEEDLRSIDSNQALEILQKLHELERNKSIPDEIKEQNNEVSQVLQSTKG